MNLKPYKYLLIYQYHGLHYEIYNNYVLLKIDLENLIDIFKEDNNFKYNIYIYHDVTNLFSKK